MRVRRYWAVALAGILLLAMLAIVPSAQAFTIASSKCSGETTHFEGTDYEFESENCVLYYNHTTTDVEVSRSVLYVDNTGDVTLTRGYAHNYHGDGSSAGCGDTDTHDVDPGYGGTYVLDWDPAVECEIKTGTAYVGYTETKADHNGSAGGWDAFYLSDGSTVDFETIP
jgi:hypothetical protein